MCKKKQFKYCPSEIDECMKYMIPILNTYGIKTVGCCCGHGKYPMTIVVEDALGIFDLVSGAAIPRKKRFYKKDDEGYYYIPEVLDK
jgi:hypothetical protein